MNERPKPEIIARAERILVGLQDLREDIEGDCRALKALLEAHDDAEDELSRARALKRVAVMHRSISECLAAFSRGRS